MQALTRPFSFAFRAPIRRIALIPVRLPNRFLSTSNRQFDQSTLTESLPKKTAIGKINRRLQITFTCTADIPINQSTEIEIENEEIKSCGHRSTHQFSAVSYEKGIVLIECPGCKNRHLIADNLSWFADTPSPAHPNGLPLNTPKFHRTIEDLMREKGEEVTIDDGGFMGATWTVEGKEEK